MKRIGVLPLAIVVPAVFLVGIALTMALNLWTTEGSRTPARFTEGELAGVANPADIRGSYTLADIAAAFPDVTVAILAAAFGVTGEASGFQVKELEGALAEGAYEVGTDSVRLFVARWMRLPFEPEPGTGLPARAMELLVARGGLTPSERADLEGRVVGGTAAPAPAPAAETTAAPAAEAHTPAAQADRAVKGSTTFGDLAAWGVERDALEDLLGGTIGETGTTVRDHAASQGIEFSTVRTEIQALVDASR